MKNYIELVKDRKNLSYDEMRVACEQLFEEQTENSFIKEFLQQLAQKGETATEITALVDVMRAQALSLPQLEEAAYFDNCGTGGDGLKSFNISTTAAFVISAAAVKVAKHGNRKVSSASGSADLLEVLGIPTNLPLIKLSEQLKESHLAFIFAPAVHPKLKKISEIRAEIGQPTIFNLVGPLVNPVNLTYQLTGINRKELIVAYAEVLKKLGRKRALVVSGADGMDEAALHGETACILLEAGELIPFTITPEEMGLKHYSVEAIKGGTPTENAVIFQAVLRGEEGPYLDAVLLNAGLAFYTVNKVPTIQAGIKLAQKLIASGRAYEQYLNIRNDLQLGVAQ